MKIIKKWVFRNLNQRKENEDIKLESIKPFDWPYFEYHHKKLKWRDDDYSRNTILKSKKKKQVLILIGISI